MICDGSTPNEVYVILGNGFDIECGLPTDYRSFLSFLASIESIIEKNADTIDGKTDAIKHFKLHEVISERLVIEDVETKYWEKVLKTFWYKHFQQVNIKNGWVDFENEISKLIKMIEESMFRKEDGHLLSEDDYLIAEYSSTLYDVLEYMIPDVSEIEGGGMLQGKFGITYRELAKRLRDELEVFIGGLEKYLLEYVSEITPEKKNSITELISQITPCEKRYVLTFNYTPTFERMLEEARLEADFCYVHGKAGSKRNNMVLGIDEHLDKEEISNYISFASFRKYNQRIFKETDSRYVDWVTSCKNKPLIRKKLYIFGHSLGVSDKDILSSFILSPNMDTHVYYHSLENFNKLVGNMTAIIEMDNMIRMNGGTYRAMAFLPQSSLKNE